MRWPHNSALLFSHSRAAAAEDASAALFAAVFSEDRRQLL